MIVDAVMSFPTVLRPFDDFETVYQGQAPNTPIAFPGGLDQRAGEPGFSPNLQKGAAIPMGSRIELWIPNIFDVAGNVYAYEYRVKFRLRNVLDFRDRREPFHLPNQDPGVPDTTGGATAARFVVLCGSQVIAYEQPVAGTATEGQVNLLNQSFVPMGGTDASPLVPNGSTAVLTQGVFDPVTDPYANTAMFNVFRFDAEADEIIVMARRVDIGAGSWDFASGGADAGFSNIYGNGSGTHSPVKEMGIYLFAGTNP